MIVEQAMEFFGMDTHSSVPTQNKPLVDISTADGATKIQETNRLLRMFLQHYGYGNFSLEAEDEVPMANHTPSEPAKYIVIGTTPEGQKLVVKVRQPLNSQPPVEPKQDRLFNYCSNLCHWALHLMQLDDTAKEGDTDKSDNQLQIQLGLLLLTFQVFEVLH